MSLPEHVSLILSAANFGVPRSNFGIPLILSANAAFAERVRTYLSIEDVADDFASTSPEYLAANAFFSQNPYPEKVMIGRAVGKPTMAYRLDVTGSPTTVGTTYAVTALGSPFTTTVATYTTKADFTFTADNTTELFTATAHGMATGDGPYRLTTSTTLPAGLTIDTDYYIIASVALGVTDPVNTYQLATSKANALAGTEVLITSNGTGTHTLRRATNDVVNAQLIAQLNAIVSKNFTAVQTGSTGSYYAVITGTTAGDWFSLAVNDVTLLKNAMTHAEPATTIATDLTAIRAVDDSWYLLYTLYNSDAYVKAAAAAIEGITTSPKIYAADLMNSESATLADGGADTLDFIQGLNYDRTFVTFHPAPNYMNGAAWAGIGLAYTPGEATWKFKQPAGVPVFTLSSTGSTNLVNKNGNFIQTTAGLDIMREGVMVGGEFIDKIRDLDWLRDEVVKSIFEVLAAAKKVPFTNAGIAMIENALRGALTRAFNAGVIDEDFTISIPTVANVSANNRALRILPDVKFGARMQGAVHKVLVTGTISV